MWSRYKSNGVRYKSNGVRYKSNGVRIEVIFVSIDFHTRLSNTYACPDPPNMNDLFSFVKVYSIGLSTITLLICQHRFRDRSRMR